MAGITDLQTLLQSMEPILKPGEYVFTTLLHPLRQEISELKPVSVFYEDEGVSLVIERKT